MAEPVELPEKLFFKIGEVSRIVGAEPHVLRYWEKEFPPVRPRKSRGRQRLYRRADVEILLRIKSLLHEEGYTIAGARKKLAAERRKGGAEPQQVLPGLLSAEEPSPPAPPDEATKRLMSEVERLKEECQSLRQARAVATRRYSAAEETLRQVHRELERLVVDVERLEKKQS